MNEASDNTQTTTLLDGRLQQESQLAPCRGHHECVIHVQGRTGTFAVRVRFYMRNGNACIEVKDNGNGSLRAMTRDSERAGAPGAGFRGILERVKQLGGSWS